MELDRAGRVPATPSVLARLATQPVLPTLARLSVLPALAVAGWLLAGLPLLLLGWFAPLPATLLGVPPAALLCWAGARRLGAIAGDPPGDGGAPWQVAGVVGVAAASGVVNAIMHSEQVAVRRDPATYTQYAAWIAAHGELPVPTQVEAFGGPDPALVFKSVGFFAADGAVVPQFMPGPPMLFAIGHWLGVPFLVPAVLGALAVLTVAGVVARLAGARWALVGATAFAVSLPILYTSRTTFSEIPSLILLFGGVALAHDALARRERGRALLAGLVFGLAVLVRVDGLRDVLPVLAFAGLLIGMRRLRRPVGVVGPPLLAGLVAGAGLGMLAAYLLARPYLSYLSGSVRPLLLICAGVLVLTAAGTAAAPALARVRLPPWLPRTGAVLVVLLMAALYARPWVQTVTRVPDNPDDRRTFEMIEQIQRANGLPADGTRLYFENSLHWVTWYVGAPAVLLATIAAALLVRRLLRGGSSFEWLLPLAIVGWTTVTTLLRPEITPDHPWAARRLVPVVIPGLILLAAYGLARLRRLTDRHGPVVLRWGMALAVLLVLAPPAVTSIGTAFTPVERGEAAAVEAMCARIPADASVLTVERVTGDRFVQVVRGMCGRPAAQVARRGASDLAPESEVRRLAERVRAAGRVPVVLGAEDWHVAPYGTPSQVMRLVTRQDERSLTEAPNGTWSLRMNVWMALA
ncbi:glycosyltransferase family 39 protein [Nonomuraea gerenzanensis]|uniref:Permeases of the major facilitator superfamily n=1 Tax=Nonomuraea gerenzanensis TaxID=93944 RepID=A0A1M4E0R0_9ACTN|nr:glycosyltransferase family 39 protein [Nonomuraea gerenzanensis]UBU14687.1 glycosyltransferase family 39 protein [Nonomuraea gerenzanensis]SBO92410.1 Permeases of the major facilitator superfamily [Nonomuraea gerenzanensis]